MGQPVDAGAGGTDPSVQSGGTGSATGDGTTSTGVSDSGTDSANAAASSAQSATYTQAEYDALRIRMQEADRRSSAFEAEMKAIRDKDLPAMEKLTRDLTEAQAQVVKMEADTQNMRVENAFLTDNTHAWQNPATALKLLDRSKITIDSEGNVAGLKDALAALAKSDAYLLKPAAADGGAPPAGKAPLGTPPANGGVGGGTTPSADALGKRFPALRTRLGG